MRLWPVVALILLGFGFWLLRTNAQQAAQRRDHIVQADQAGQDTTIDRAALQQFARDHMNASVQFDLIGSYQRAEAATLPEVSGQVYDQAQAVCKSKNPVDQAKCVAAYVSAHQPATAPAKSMPNLADYHYRYSSPVWTPDPAGWCLLAAATLLGLVAWNWLFAAFGRG